MPDPISDADFPEAVNNISSRVFAELLRDGENDSVAARDFGERYTFRAILGEGGQGIVVEAHDDLLDREVAIKALKKRHNPAHINMLTREAKIGATLEHPNILPTYDLGADEIDSPLLVMRKIVGESLEGLLKKLYESQELQRSRWRLLNIFIAVLNAVEFAHSRGVLHLDLKPANITLGAHGEIYVIDWGFARKVNEKIAARPGGTMHYIAPERLRDEAFDERADIFSLGVILYRLLTARHPRDIGKIAFPLYRETYQNYPLIPATAREATIAPELSAIAAKAMADDAAERYATVGAMINDLERFMEMLPVSAYREGIFERLRRQIKKHQKTVTAAAIIVCLLVVTGLALYSRYETQQAKRRVEEENAAMAAAENTAHAERNRQLRLRYQARGVMQRASDLLQKSRTAIESQPTPELKNALIAPVLARLDEAAEIDPTFAEVYELRAQAHKLAYNWAAALADYERAYALDSSYLMALYSAGMLLADVFQQPEAAREKFRLMQSVSPTDEYAELGQAQVEIATADKFLKLPPSHADYAQRKTLAAELYDRVLTRLDAIEKINPALSDIWYLRGLIYQKNPRRMGGAEGEKDAATKALAAYNKFLTARQDSPSAFHNRGDAKRVLGDIDGAIADYTAALKVDANFLWSLRNRGYLWYKEKHDSARALADIDRAIAIAPQVAWSYVDRAAVHESSGDYAAAFADYQHALAIEPENPRLLYRVGVLELYREQPVAAEKYFSQAVQFNSDEDNSTLYHRRGLAYLALANYADAISDFESAIIIRRRVQPDGLIYPALMRFLALKMSGMPIDVNDFGHQLNAPATKAWLTALGSFYLGEADEDDVLQLAGDPAVNPALTAEQKMVLAQKNAEAICEARFYLGAYYLANGNRDKSREHLTAAIATDARLYMEHALAKILLRKLSGE